MPTMACPVCGRALLARWALVSDSEEQWACSACGACSARVGAPIAGQVAVAIDGFVSFSVSMQGLGGAELLAWLPISAGARFAQAGGFFVEWDFGGEPRWTRFAYRGVVFSQAVFAAAEVLAERDPALLPPGALWLLSAPRHQPSRPSA